MDGIDSKAQPDTQRLNETSPLLGSEKTQPQPSNPVSEQHGKYPSTKATSTHNPQAICTDDQGTPNPEFSPQSSSSSSPFTKALYVKRFSVIGFCVILLLVSVCCNILIPVNYQIIYANTNCTDNCTDTASVHGSISMKELI